MIPEAIIKAVRGGYVETVRTWLECGGSYDVNEATAVRWGGPAWVGVTGIKLLHLSLCDVGRENRCKMLRLLLDHGADIDASTSDGCTALYHCEHPEEAALLLDRGANVNAPDIRNLTPLHVHVDSEFALVHLLVRRGADIFVRSRQNQDAEAHARAFMEEIESQSFLNSVYDWALHNKASKTAEFLAAVKRAGSWRAYWRAPRVELVRLRSLCDRGRAEPPSPRASSGSNELSAAEAEVKLRKLKRASRSSRRS